MLHHKRNCTAWDCKEENSCPAGSDGREPEVLLPSLKTYHLNMKNPVPQLGWSNILLMTQSGKQLAGKRLGTCSMPAALPNDS